MSQVAATNIKITVFGVSKKKRRFELDLLKRRFWPNIKEKCREGRPRYTKHDPSCGPVFYFDCLKQTEEQTPGLMAVIHVAWFCIHHQRCGWNMFKCCLYVCPGFGDSG